LASERGAYRALILTVRARAVGRRSPRSPWPDVWLAHGVWVKTDQMIVEGLRLRARTARPFAVIAHDAITVGVITQPCG